MEEFALDLVPVTKSAAEPYKHHKQNVDVPRDGELIIVAHRVILNGNNTAYTKAHKNKFLTCPGGGCRLLGVFMIQSIFSSLIIDVHC